jgi:carbonic anhydrase/acetyltransferase-like protein (isoleucine patch superfamily)
MRDDRSLAQSLSRTLEALARGGPPPAPRQEGLAPGPAAKALGAVAVGLLVLGFGTGHPALILLGLAAAGGGGFLALPVARRILPELAGRMDEAQAHVGLGATVSADAVLEPGSSVEMGATVGARALVRAGAVVRMGADVGREAVLEKGAVVSWGATVQAGAVVGEGAIVGAGSNVLRGACPERSLGATRRNLRRNLGRASAAGDPAGCPSAGRSARRPRGGRLRQARGGAACRARALAFVFGRFGRDHRSAAAHLPGSRAPRAQPARRGRSRRAGPARQ